MSWFNALFGGKPEVATLARKKDVNGLIKALKYGVKHPDWGARTPLVVSTSMALAEIGDQRALGPIVDALITNGHLLSPDCDGAVLQILVRCGKNAVEPLLKALDIAQGSHSKELLAWILGRIGDERAASHLIQHGEGGSRIWALGQVGGGLETAKFLMRYLVDDKYCDQQFFGIETPTRAFGFGKFGKETADLLVEALNKAQSSEQGVEGHEKSRWAGKVAKIAEALCELRDPRGLEVMLRLWAKSHEHAVRVSQLPEHSLPDSETLYVISKFKDPRVTSLLVATVERYKDGDYRKDESELDYMTQVDYHRCLYAALGLMENGNTRGSRLLVDVTATERMKRYVNYFSPETYHDVARRSLINAGSHVKEALTSYLTVQDEEVHSVVAEILDSIGTQGKGQQVEHDSQAQSVWNPPQSSDAKEYLRRCLDQEFQEQVEKRTFRDDPGFAKVLEPLNAQNFSEAIQMAKRIIPRHPDFDLPYKWLGSALREKGSLDESRKAYCEGLKLSRRKLIILTDMGETEFESGNIDAAVYAWSQAIHCLGKNPIDYNAYLLMSYVAQGLKLGDVANAFTVRVDKLRAGQVRLEPQKANRLTTLAGQSNSAPIKEVLTQLRKKYL